jgi:hypothetical protein
MGKNDKIVVIKIRIEEKNMLIAKRTERQAPVSFYKMTQTKLARINKRNGWLFDWKATLKKGYEIYALTLEGDDRIQGLISFKDDEERQCVTIDILESAPHNSELSDSDVKWERVGRHLVAIAAKFSFECGQEGFVLLQSKTSRLEYYSNMGATRWDNSHMFNFDPIASKRLIEECL